MIKTTETIGEFRYFQSLKLCSAFLYKIRSLCNLVAFSLDVSRYVSRIELVPQLLSHRSPLPPGLLELQARNNRGFYFYQSEMQFLLVRPSLSELDRPTTTTCFIVKSARHHFMRSDGQFQKGGNLMITHVMNKSLPTKSQYQHPTTYTLSLVELQLVLCIILGLKFRCFSINHLLKKTNQTIRTV